MEASNDNFTAIYGPHVPTQKMAIAAGAKYYFNGKACRRGHVAPRYSSAGCTACHELRRRENREKFRLESKEWRASNPEKVAVHNKKKAESGYGKLYYERNREDQIAKSMAWNQANPDKARENMRRYAANHRDELLEKKRLSRLQNLEQAKEREREWRSGRREELAAASRQWRIDNPEKRRVIDRNKKLRRRGAEGTHTLADIDALLVSQKYRCAECKKSVRKSYHVDHIKPLALGGTNWPSNLQIL